MAFWDRIRFALGAAPATVEFADEPDITTVDGRIQFAGGSSPFLPSITRETALQVPAVLRGRNLICGISTLPLTQYAPSRVAERSSLLDQIDPQVPNVVTVAQTVEDLLFDGIAWWKVLTRGWNDFPSEAQRVAPSRVHLDPPQGAEPLSLLPSGADPRAAVWIDSKVMDGRDLIRFDSPNPPLLVAARRAIRRAAKLEMAAERYADSPRALGYFTPTEGADPAEDDVIAELLADWQACRNTDAEGYVPAALKYNPLTNPTPADLQLVQLQQRAALDIANAIGLDPEDLGISTTSRTYQNATDRRRDRINDVLATYMKAVTDRLSMNDVTRRGYRVAFGLDEYLKADPITRAQQAQILKTLGALTVDEIRETEGRPALSPAQKRELEPAPQEAPAVQQTNATFSDSTEPTRVSFSTADFKADAGKRTVTGMLIPFGVVGRNAKGKFRFATGSVEWNKAAVSRIKLNREHDRTALLGAATSLRESAEGIGSAFKVARGPLGDQALSEAEDEVLDGLSAEVDILDYQNDPQNEGVFLVLKARLTGAAITASPAFDDARLTSVAASAHTEGDVLMDPVTEQAPASPAAAPAAVAFTADDLKAPASPAAFTADDLKAAVRDVLAEGDRPTAVNPRREVAFTRSELPYRFDGGQGEHEFSSDIFAMASRRDGAGVAQERIEKFMSAAFATATTDVNELNPTRNRPDMYVAQLTYSTPIWDAISKGTITDNTPFTFPKFNSSSGLVGAHTEGTEPTVGAFTTTSDTVTPTGVSGKVEINREVVDAGGNPQVSALIWNEIKEAWSEALEATAVTLLDGLTPTAIALTAGGVDEALEGEVTAALAALQFIRGGARMRDLFLHGALFKALVAARDDNGRKLFPILGASNASGTTAGDFGDVMIGAYRARPAWALSDSATAVKSSYLFNRSDLHGWATSPRRLDFDYQVKSVFMGVWGYKATVCSRLAGVREITYDPTV